MFDGLRGDAPDTSGFDEPVEYFSEDQQPASDPKRRPTQKRKAAGKIFGLDAKQRFIIALMLMAAVCMLGTMCMFLTQKFIIP